MTTLLAFALALALLIAVHEWGHYRVAVACGVRVEQFSLGFGPVLLRWRRRRDHPGQNTEFVIRALPLGGFVRMQEQAPLGADKPSMAFADQPLRRRAAIVAAGALANFALAWVLLTVHGWVGQPQALPVLPVPEPASWAQQQGWQGREQVQAVRTPDGQEVPVETWRALLALSEEAQAAGQALTWVLADGRERLLQWPDGAHAIGKVPPARPLLASLGWSGPHIEPVIASVLPGSPAQAAGLQAGDVVLAIEGQLMGDAQALRARIQALGAPGSDLRQVWLVQREGQGLSLQVQPERVEQQGRMVGRVGAVIGKVALGPRESGGLLQAPWQAAGQVVSLAGRSLQALGGMLTGAVSWRELGGPVTMADHAGRSAEAGWQTYLVFLAVLSVGLGVLNLLPVPMLDGGHLMYYLWEWLTGRPPGEQALRRLQWAGLWVIGCLMMLAFYNDLSRYLP